MALFSSPRRCAMSSTVLAWRTVDEAIELSDAGIGNPILILSPILPEKSTKSSTTAFLSPHRTPSLSSCCRIARAPQARRVGLNVEVDTGMGRTGVLASEVAALLRRIEALPGVWLGGLWTHFPVSDEDESFTREQVAKFRVVARRTARGRHRRAVCPQRKQRRDTTCPRGTARPGATGVVGLRACAGRRQCELEGPRQS